MELIVLIIHLLVSICLIGLVLLQRSEGGALGMGGGGGGALMSGRGAADALAKMTSVAGGFFLVTSLGLTVLSGAAANATGGSSIFDALRSQPAPVTAPATPAPAQPEQTRPDPTESSAPEAADTRLASVLPGPSEAAAAEPTSTRAGPLAASATPPRPQPAATQRTASNPPPRQPAATQRSGGSTVPASANNTAPTTTRATPPPAATRSGSGTTPANSGGSQTASRPLVIPNTSGSSVGGIQLTDEAPLQPESLDAGNGVQAVRRERAGPDQ